MTAIQQQQYLQLPFVPGNSIVSQFIGPLCGDPVGTGNALPRELCEFWKQKKSSNSDISTCLVYPIRPRISWEGHPRAAHARSDGCSHPIVLPQRHHPTFSFFNTLPILMGQSTEDNNHHFQPQSLGPKQKRGTPVFKSYHKGTEIGECHIAERNKRAPERPPALGGEVDVPVEGMHPPKLHDRTTQHLKLA